MGNYCFLKRDEKYYEIVLTFYKNSNQNMMKYIE